MTIVRIDAEARWSDVVIHNNTLYYTGVPENLDADAFEQTANTLAQIDALNPQKIVISPGPCTPDDAGISLEVIRYFAGKIPLLGVCLGHQAMAQAFGATVVRAAKVMHGKTSPITHNGQGVFQGLANPLTVTRYHSLVVAPETLPDCFEVTAWSETQEIMGIRHREWDMEGVQFHPESILSEQGHQLLANFLNR